MGVLSSSILFKYERSRGHLFVLSWARVQWVAMGSVVCCCCSPFSPCSCSIGMTVSV